VPTTAEPPPAAATSPPAVAQAKANANAVDKLANTKRPAAVPPSPRVNTTAAAPAYPGPGSTTPAAANRSPYGDSPTANTGGTTQTAPIDPIRTPVETSKAPAQGPEVQCAGMPYFKNLMCMERQCLRSENQSHPDCLKWRKNTRTE
jgi:hypothetical protein